MTAKGDERRKRSRRGKPKSGVEQFVVAFENVGGSGRDEVFIANREKFYLSKGLKTLDEFCKATDRNEALREEFRQTVGLSHD